jgi:lipopolysaccharide export system permease protein
MEAQVFGSILHRMILWELTKVFVMSLVGITGILLMAGIVAEASQQGLGPTQILAAIPLLVPSTLPYTIPATTLFATCVVYGRLAADNEILAIKAAGINLMTVVKPGLILGLVMSGSTMGLYYRIIPYTHYLLRAMVFNDAEELLYSLLNKHHMISGTQLPYSMFVKSVQGKKLVDPVFKRKDPNGKVDLVATAREAELRVDPVKKLLLIHMRWGNGIFADGSPCEFEDRVFDVALPPNFGNEGQRRARDMTWQEILEHRAELTAEIAGVDTEIAQVSEALRQPTAPGHLTNHLQNLADRRHFLEQQRTALDVELQMRPSLSIGCLCFILIGCPVGIWFSRSDYLSSFITCFLPIVFVYYPLMLCGTNMAKEGRLNMIPLVWGADALIGAIGVFLFAKLLRN